MVVAAHREMGGPGTEEPRPADAMGGHAPDGKGATRVVGLREVMAHPRIGEVGLR